MKDEVRYHLEGEFTLNDKNKMQEMNDLILDLLRKTGICKLTTKTLCGKKIPVVETAKPDKAGIIKFNYSIFEKRERKTNYYDTNTGELITPDRGLNHFGLTMNMIMVVLEAYSETPCYLMYEDRLSDVSYFAEIVEELTGRILEFNRRARAFDTIVFFKQTGKYKDLEYSIYDYPSRYCEVSMEQFFFVIFILYEPIKKPEKEESFLDKSMSMAYSCMELLKSSKELKEDALQYIYKLMDMTLEERETESKIKHPLDFISSVAPFLPAAYLVKIYAEAYEIDFFKLWNEIGKNGYWEVIEPKKSKKEPRKVSSRHILYEIYKKKNEDDFIGVWEKDGMLFSKDIIDDIAYYKKTYLEIKERDLEHYDLVSNIVACENDLQTFWNIDKYLDKDMVSEIVKNKDDMRYKKAVYALRLMINDEIELFSELTEQQIREWVLRTVNWRRYADKYWHYIDLLSNKKRRQELLGF